MIDRYTRPAMGAVWTEESKLGLWLEVELLACEALAQRGEVPADVPAQIRARARVNVARMREIERAVGHDIIAFVTSIAEQCGPEGRYLHLGLTSSDVLDTAFAVQLVRAADLLITAAVELRDVIGAQARAYRGQVVIGRTHGIHAEPTTFGLKLAGWYTEMDRNVARLRAAREAVRVGTLSGAVGTFAHLPPDVEAYVCERLGLRAEPVATQVVPRDRHAEFFATLAIVAGSVERYAVEIRHLQRTEVQEAEEPFGRGQKGSSAMPHKRNPIRCERIAGLARLLRAHALTGIENVALWHERDISHSSVERVVLPDACLVADYVLDLATRTLDGLLVYPDRMRRNLELTRGLVFSGTLLLELARAGLQRDDAYRLVQAASREAWENGRELREVAGATAAIREVLGAEALARAFDLRHHLRHVDAIFDRTLREATS